MRGMKEMKIIIKVIQIIFVYIFFKVIFLLIMWKKIIIENNSCNLKMTNFTQKLLCFVKTF